MLGPSQNEVKFDEINMLEWNKLVELTLVGRELGDHLKESFILRKNLQYKKWKAEETMNPSMDIEHYESRNEDKFFYVDSIKELWDEVSKYNAQRYYECRFMF